MHELSICRAISDTVVDHAAGRPVRSVRVRIGHFRQVVPDTLAYCWGLHTSATELEGCALELDEVPAAIECRSCGATTTLDLPVLRCGGCSGTDVALVTGEEFLIESIEVGERTY